MANTDTPTVDLEELELEGMPERQIEITYKYKVPPRRTFIDPGNVPELNAFRKLERPGKVAKVTKLEHDGRVAYEVLVVLEEPS